MTTLPRAQRGGIMDHQPLTGCPAPGAEMSSWVQSLDELLTEGILFAWP